jgi:hypothetical protein
MKSEIQVISTFQHPPAIPIQTDANAFFRVTGVDWAGCADPWHDFLNLLYTQNDQRVAAGLIVPKQLPGLNTNLSTPKVVRLVHLRGDHHTRSRR